MDPSRTHSKKTKEKKDKEGKKDKAHHHEHPPPSSQPSRPNLSHAESSALYWSGHVAFRILRAQGLKNADGVMGLSDPYAKLRCELEDQKSEFKTRVIDNNLSPTWDEVFIFKAFAQAKTINIDLSIWDKDDGFVVSL